MDYIQLATTKRDHWQQQVDLQVQKRDASKPLSQRAKAAEEDEKRAQADYDRQQALFDAADKAAAAALADKEKEASKLQDKKELQQ